MNIGRVLYILVFVTAVFAFSMPFVAFAQQNSELHEAVIAAQRDAKAQVNQIGWWIQGCILIGFLTYHAPQPPAARLVGKSPEYVDAYTQTYKQKVENLRMSAVVPGCLTTVFSAGILFLILEGLD